MKTWRMVLVLGLAVASAGAWAQTDGQGKAPFGSPDIYNTGKTGSTTLPPQGEKTPGGVAENPMKKTLQDIYNRCVAATKKRDESVLAALRAQDFTYRDAKGKTYARSDMEATERQTLANAITIDQVSSQVESVKTSEGKVTATLHHYFAETANDPQNTPHKLTLTTTSEEIWTSAANVWKLQSVKVVSQRETLDGKPYDPSAANNKRSNQNNQNNSQNGNRQSGRSSGYSGYRAPRIKTPKIRSIGGKVISG